MSEGKHFISSVTEWMEWGEKKNQCGKCEEEKVQGRKIQIK